MFLNSYLPNVFLAYLQGIETLPNVIRVNKYRVFLAYLQGIETQLAHLV